MHIKPINTENLEHWWDSNPDVLLHRQLWWLMMMTLLKSRPWRPGVDIMKPFRTKFTFKTSWKFSPKRNMPNSGKS
jgi:hypothetical protein